jgi:acyl carrier protein
VPGEVYIGGAGLARGYHKRPDLTASHFIPHPFSREKGARLYKTGDSALYLPDGNIEFLGRLDQQVKIRGFRIELEEIEAVLVQYPGVEQAMVLVSEKAPNDYYLRACIVPNGGPAPAVDDLRAFLKEHLPQYMIPSSFVFQEALPLLPNGKLDRKVVQQETLREESRAAYIGPRTELEEVISKVWEESLRLDQVSTKDNFFDVGGHSLLMVKVQSKLKEALNREISMTDLFKYPTISSLAQYLNNGQSESASQDQIQSRAERQKEAVQRRRQLAQEEAAK